MRVIFQIGLISTAFVQVAVAQSIPNPADRIDISNGVWQAVNTGCPTLPIDDQLRQRLVNVAAEEWARFKFPVTDHRKKGRDIVVNPEGGELIPAKLNRKIDGIARGALRLGHMEDDKEVRKAIGGYWAVVPGQDSLPLQSQIFAKFGDAGWAYPWSAAFISYIFCEAGVSDLSKFKRSSGHAGYVDQAIETADGIAQGVLKARDVATGLPKVGDLLCADRSADAAPLRTIADRKAKPGGRAMHCDLVVKVQTGSGGYVAVLGGNVVQSASLTLINVVQPKDGGPARVETSQDVNGARPWFVVLELQADGSALLENSPAIQRLRK